MSGAVEWEEPKVTRARSGVPSEIRKRVVEMTAELQAHPGQYAVLRRYAEEDKKTSQSHRTTIAREFPEFEFAARAQESGGATLYVRFVDGPGYE